MLKMLKEEGVHVQIRPEHTTDACSNRRVIKGLF